MYPKNTASMHSVKPKPIAVLNYTDPTVHTFFENEYHLRAQGGNNTFIATIIIYYYAYM